MSVAFRRESDEEHLEPKFERPIPAGPNLVTARGLALIAAKLAESEAIVAQGGAESELEDAKRTLRYWRTRHATAELTPPPSDDEVGFGSRVTFKLHGKKRSIDIVGDDEADPATGLIVFSAPLARALIGAGPGEKVDFGGKADAIEILSVGPIGD